jgi:hypothetical protein
MSGISKSRVLELREELDEEVERFRSRELEGPYPYVWLDATYVKARQGGRVVSVGPVATRKLPGAGSPCTGRRLRRAGYGVQGWARVCIPERSRPT